MPATKSKQLTLNYQGSKLSFGQHSNGQYRKKYRGKACWLGHDPDQVLDKWLRFVEEVDKSLTGEYSFDIANMTVIDLCNQFLTAKHELPADLQLSESTLRGYQTACRLLIDGIGADKKLTRLGDADFERLRVYLSKPRGSRAKSLTTVKSYMRSVSVIFNWAVDERYLDRLPYRKSAFRPPTAKAINVERYEKERNSETAVTKVASREEIKAVLAIADKNMELAIHLGLHGLGNTDIAELSFSDVKPRGWIRRPRSKTGKLRELRLWPETQSLIESFKAEDTDPDRKIIIGRNGADWIPRNSTNQISKRFSQLAKTADVDREGLSFYSLRHCFQSKSEDFTQDYPAVSRILGRSKREVADHYRDKISDERLEAVTESMRCWFFELEGNSND